MLLAAIRQVECVGGCGGGGDVSTLGAIGLAVALISVGLAVYAVKLSKQSADSARASLAIAEEQHSVFMKEIRASATFEVTVEAVEPEASGTVPSGEQRVMWGIALKNVGEKAATHVGLSFYAPRQVGGLTWALTRAVSRKWGSDQRTDSEQVLEASDGSRWTTRVLRHELDRLGVDEHYVVFVTGIVSGLPPGVERRLPGKLIAWSEDLADGVPQVQATGEISVTIPL